MATEVVEQLLQDATRFEFAIVAYCAMPDHLHALVEATSDGSDLKAFMKHFKQITGFHYRQRTRETLWQPGYHEHILRAEEVTEVVARYILENPVRAGLTREIGDYRFAGSAIYELQDILTLWEQA